MSLDQTTIFKMENLFAKFAIYAAVILLQLVGKVVSDLTGYYNTKTVSGGVSHGPAGPDDSSKEYTAKYGFLPSSTNTWSLIFLIITYEAFLYLAHSFGGRLIYRGFGRNIFALFVSQVFESIPESMMLLATSFLSSKEKAEDYLVTGVGLLTGSSILLLTLLWGACFFYNKKTILYVHRDHRREDDGDDGWKVHTDAETRFHAYAVLFSLIPLVIIISPAFIGQLGKIHIFVSFAMSGVLLVGYFKYQRSDSLLWKARLGNAQVEMDVQAATVNPSVYSEDHIYKSLELKNRGAGMKTEEILDQFNKWLNVVKKLMDDYFDRMEMAYNQDRVRAAVPVFKQLASEARLEITKTQEWCIKWITCNIHENHLIILMKTILKGCSDETPNAIYTDLADDIMDSLIITDNDAKPILVNAVERFLNSYDLKKRSQGNNRVRNIMSYYWAEGKNTCYAISLLVFGGFTLAFLGEPLVESVKQFAKSLNMNPFFVSFILLPLAKDATNLNVLTFPEIYHKVFMNNTMGFSVLVAIMYFHGLTWHFAAEILPMFIVCLIMGLLPAKLIIMQTWTLVIAIAFFPLSMLAIYIVSRAHPLA